MNYNSNKAKKVLQLRSLTPSQKAPSSIPNVCSLTCRHPGINIYI